MDNEWSDVASRSNPMVDWGLIFGHALVGTAGATIAITLYEIVRGQM